jgi:L-rhamnose mutarotase
MLKIRENQESHVSLIPQVVMKCDPSHEEREYSIFMYDPQDEEYFVTWITMKSCSST